MYKILYFVNNLIYFHSNLINNDFKSLHNVLKLVNIDFNLINLVYNSLNTEFLMITLILFLIIATITAAINDYKYQIISNKLTVSIIFFGIFINSAFSIILKNTNFIIDSLVFGILTFLFCYLLWKFGLWGGGDVKLFTAIATVLPIHPTLYTDFLKLFNFEIFNLLNSENFIHFPIIVQYPFSFTVIFNSILLSFPFLLTFIIFNYYNNINLKELYLKLKDINLTYKSLNEKLRLKIKEIKAKDLVVRIIYTLLFTSIFTFINYLFDNLINPEKILLSVIFGVFCGLFFSSFMKYLIKKFRKIANLGSIKIVNIENLKEGMILDKTVIKITNVNANKNKIHKLNFNENKTYISNISNDLNNNKTNENNLFIKNDGKICTLKTKTIAGLYKKDIEILKKLVNKNLIDKNLKVKITVPFGPSIAIGLIVAIFIGDISNLFFILFKSALNGIIWI